MIAKAGKQREIREDMARPGAEQADFRTLVRLQFENRREILQRQPVRQVVRRAVEPVPNHPAARNHDRAVVVHAIDTEHARAVVADEVLRRRFEMHLHGRV